MLIKCPECGKEISDKAKNCPNCGLPIETESCENHCKINGEMVDFSKIVDVLPKITEVQDGVHPYYYYIKGIIKDNTKLSAKSLDDITTLIIKNKGIPKEFNGQIMSEPINRISNTPKCPTCGSTNIIKIGTVNRVVSTGVFGLASSKIGKTMQCKNCGYKW